MKLAGDSPELFYIEFTLFTASIDAESVLLLLRKSDYNLSQKYL
ncbi:hypothetical protein LEP1GSC125_3261 [Leptospira mayottensis 200901122]|uniref:Uncharacterized protein n=1 Tax=Leptospira mayottensis 200901122 TaxID=1193010 RepID=A0AA87SW36_9LEPT|nr:hypothetical protein LEP1GSC125_3261 [Leptospira mayottensis 200901122]